MYYDIYISHDYNKRTCHRYYGEQAAIEFAINCAECDNVQQVDMVDGMTGEILFTISDGIFTYLAGVGDLF